MQSQDPLQWGWWAMVQEKRILALLKAFLGEDGFVHPHLRLQAAGHRGRGLFAAEHIARGEVLLQVPFDRMVRRGNLAWSELLGFRESLEGLDEDEELVVFLAALRKFGLYSSWYHYIRTLPFEEPNSTLKWQPEDVAVLRGSCAHAPARALRRQLLRLCGRFSRTLRCQELRWAAAQYWSRAHTITLPAEPPDSKRAGRPQRDVAAMAQSFHALLPGVDLVNFGTGSKNHFRTAGDSLVYIAGSNYKPGEEVLDAYGGGKNDTYLMVYYGFLHEDAEESYAVLEPAIRKDRLRGLKRRILASLPRAKQQLRVHSGDVEGAGLLRLGLLVPEEASAYNVYALLAHVPLPASRLQQTELATMQWLADECRQRLLAIRRTDPPVGQSCRGPHGLLAFEYRRRTAWLWQQCLENAEERLRHLRLLPLTPSPAHRPSLLRGAAPVQPEALAAPAGQGPSRGCARALHVRLAQLPPPRSLGSSGLHQHLAGRAWLAVGRGSEGSRAAVRLAGAATRLQRATPQWIGKLARAALLAPPPAGRGRGAMREAARRMAISSLQCTPCRSTARSPVRPCCDLRAFAWLGAARGPAAAEALLAFPRHLEGIVQAFGPARA